MIIPNLTIFYGLNLIEAVDIEALGSNNADNAFVSSAVVANANGSALERQEYIQQLAGALTDVADETTGTATLANLLRALIARNLPRVARKEYTFSTATTGATGTHTLFTVTGVVRIQLFAVCRTNLVAAVAGATIEVGTPASTAGLIDLTTAADLIAGEIWDDASPITKIEPMSQIPEVIIGDGADIGLKIATQAVASGVIEFKIDYTPISSDGAVVAA